MAIPIPVATDESSISAWTLNVDGLYDAERTEADLWQLLTALTASAALIGTNLERRSDKGEPVKVTGQANGTMVVGEITEDDLPAPDERLQALIEQFPDVAPTIDRVREYQLRHFVTAREGSAAD